MKTYIVQFRRAHSGALSDGWPFVAKSPMHAISQCAMACYWGDIVAVEFIATLQGETQ